MFIVDIITVTYGYDVVITAVNHHNRGICRRETVQSIAFGIFSELSFLISLYDRQKNIDHWTYDILAAAFQKISGTAWS